MKWGIVFASTAFPQPDAAENMVTAAEAAGFEVLLTVDRGLEYEQNLAGRKIALIVFRTGSIALKELLLHLPACLARLASIRPGQIVRISG